MGKGLGGMGWGGAAYSAALCPLRALRGYPRKLSLTPALCSPPGGLRALHVPRGLWGAASLICKPGTRRGGEGAGFDRATSPAPTDSAPESDRDSRCCWWPSYKAHSPLSRLVARDAGCSLQKGTLVRFARHVNTGAASRWLWESTNLTR